ncbi:DUF485 domain-containing protein [Bartonella sp. HY329]|uniref:DUF485 domain-containing protein n=1 Tax=unclassified Bartonella TaxID=2645622 RepID=UPI0021C60319|nr:MULTISPECIES: DUF485 domain-containing protein [unclassified Bartonella]UXM94770.1 DUF485 domain-containing protein [Bartonella sp. HY329]UXN09093.1 DUF485 domain-containing protein [Bartonella sp. HY328]
MDEQMVARIEANPDYIELKKKRNILGWSLTLVVLIVYYGWIFIIAFNPQFLATKIGAGVTTIAIPIGIGVIVLMVALTAFYVVRANRIYDDLISRLQKEVDK